MLITTISTPKKMFFTERELEKALRDILMRAAWYGLLFTMPNYPIRLDPITVKLSLSPRLLIVFIYSECFIEGMLKQMI